MSHPPTGMYPFFRSATRIFASRLLEEPARVAQRVGKHALFDAVVGREEESHPLARVRHLFHDARVRLGVAPLERAEVDRRHGDRHRTTMRGARGRDRRLAPATPRARWSDGAH